MEMVLVFIRDYYLCWELILKLFILFMALANFIHVKQRKLLINLVV